MSETKVVNFLLAGLLIMTVVMFSWTFMYISSTHSQGMETTTVVSAFNA